jgi:predicted  nucleic acid-binding Zn-ribbon protein
MSDHPFLRFINLVAFDQKIQSLENEKVSLDHQIAATRKQEDEYARNLQDSRDRVISSQKKVDAQELEMKSLDQKEKEKKRHLENLTDYKNYQGIKAEMESIQHQQVEQEKNVLDAWNQLENAQLALQKKQHDQAQQLSELHERMKELGQKLATLDDECARLVAQRAEMETDIPTEWLEKYILMRARVSDPVVEIFHQSCGACSKMITSQDMTRARHGALVQCQSCFRLLYAPEIKEKHTP